MTCPVTQGSLVKVTHSYLQPQCSLNPSHRLSKSVLTIVFINFAASS